MNLLSYDAWLEQEKRTWSWNLRLRWRVWCAVGRVWLPVKRWLYDRFAGSVDRMSGTVYADESLLAEDWMDSDEARAWECLSNEALVEFERKLDSGAGPTGNAVVGSDTDGAIGG